MKTHVIDFKPEGRYKTPQGYLVVPGSVLARTGPQEYDGAEVGGTPGQIVQVDRPEAEVFAPEAIASFEGMPVTMGHPSSLEVDADTWRALAVGVVKDVRREGDVLVGDIWIYDAKAIKDVEAYGIEELSCGYSSDLVGDTPNLTSTNIAGNHVALVPRGRCGGECRLGDEKLINQRSDPVKKKTLLDSLLERVGLTKPTATQREKFASVLADTGIDPDTEVKDEQNPEPIDDLKDGEEKKVEDNDEGKEDIKDEGGEELAAALAKIAALEAKLAEKDVAQADAEETRTVAADAALRFKGLSIGDSDKARDIRIKAVVSKGIYTDAEAKKLADCDLKAAYQAARAMRDHDLGRSILADSNQPAKSVDYNALYNK